MKNKGQVLIGFVILIPILFGLVMLFIELVNANTLKHEMTSVVIDAIDSGLHCDYGTPYDCVFNLIDKNINYDDILIEVNDKYISVEITKKISLKKLTIKYIGYYDDYRIEKR